jgi:hypothetical protein
MTASSILCAHLCRNAESRLLLQHYERARNNATGFAALL